MHSMDNAANDWGSTPAQRNEEAQHILVKMGLIGATEMMRDNERKFVEDLMERFEQYQERTLVSVKQLFWLRDLKDRYL